MAAVMSSRKKVRVFLALPRAGVTLLGLVVLIVGLLAMHAWMGVHGPTAVHRLHPVTGPVATASESMAPALGPPIGSGNEAHVVALNGNTDSSVTAQGCEGACGTEGAALGLCVLAFIVIISLAFPVPAGRLVPGTVLLRGPPLIRLRPLSIPVPSLVRLCISRT